MCVQSSCWFCYFFPCLKLRSVWDMSLKVVKCFKVKLLTAICNNSPTICSKILHLSANLCKNRNIQCHLGNVTYSDGSLVSSVSDIRSYSYSYLIWRRENSSCLLYLHRSQVSVSVDLIFIDKHHVIYYRNSKWLMAVISATKIETSWKCRQWNKPFPWSFSRKFNVSSSSLLEDFGFP